MGPVGLTIVEKVRGEASRPHPNKIYIAIIYTGLLRPTLFHVLLHGAVRN